MHSRPIEPHLFVILGGTGDLTERKLLPAVCRLMSAGKEAARSVVLGVARSTQLDDAAFRTWAREALHNAGLSDEDAAAWCDDCVHYHALPDGGPDDYESLARRIEEIEDEHRLPGNRVLYLAMPPRVFPATIEQLGICGLSRSRGWTRVVIEKPFGRDLASARALNALVHEYFDESQVYRIDHYLGKETVQNLLVFRFANPIFESLWNRDRVESVYLTVAEDLGVGDRAGYYDHSGALRDIVQNHLTQLLTLVAMEVPATFDADAIRAEKIKVLRSVAPITPDDVVFGQYGPGAIGEEVVPGYREEDGVAEGSTTETFVALQARVDNWRWQNVPFYVRTGKRMARRLTRIVVTFKRAPVSLFGAFDHCRVHSNVLMLNLQPDEGFALAFEVKAPGDGVELVTQRLHFDYAEAFEPLHDAYVTLLQDVVEGDQTLFVHADEVEESWKLYTPLLEAGIEPHSYAAGTWGPREVERLTGSEDPIWLGKT